MKEEYKLLDAVNMICREKNISKDVLLEAVESALYLAAEKRYGTAENIEVKIDKDTCEYVVYQKKNVVEQVSDPILEISLPDALDIDGGYKVGDVVNIEVSSQNDFGRIAASNAKQVMLQKIRDEEKKVIYDEYLEKRHTVVTGIVQRFIGKNISIDLGRTDAILNEDEQIRGEHFSPTDRIKVYILDVKNGTKGTRIKVSRTHPDFVKCLFEEEVAEIADGTVEIKSIAREPGNRTKISVYSNDENVDPVGACVGMNGARVNAVTAELHNEKIDVTEWSDNPAEMIEKALSPAKVISVIADSDDKTAQVIVPDYQLSLAIGKEGQNARLAARLTGFKIDIKSETQARESGEFDELFAYDDYDDEYDYDEDYDDNSDEYYDEPESDEPDLDEPYVEESENSEDLSDEDESAEAPVEESNE